MKHFKKLILINLSLITLVFMIFPQAYAIKTALPGECFKSKKISTAFTDMHNGKEYLYLVWQLKGDDALLISYTSDLETWSGPNTVKYFHERQWEHVDFPSHYGAQSGIYTYVNASGVTQKAVCIFAKRYNTPSSSDEPGKIDYACADIRYDENDVPLFNGTLHKKYTLGGDVRSMVSVLPSPNQDGKFYLGVADEKYNLKRFVCSGNTSDVNAVSCGGEELRLTADKNLIYNAPALIATPSPDNSSNWKISSFFRGKGDILTSVGLENEDQDPYKNIEVMNKYGDKREIKQRMSPYLFNGYVFVAYKNSNNDRLRYSKIPLADWQKIISEDRNGYKLWTHCEFKDEDNKNIASSTTSPYFFEYGKELYLLYSDKTGDQLAYIKVVDEEGKDLYCTTVS